VYPTRRGLSPAVRAFIDFLTKELGGAVKALPKHSRATAR